MVSISHTKKSIITILLLLLLCSVCVAPVMAGTGTRVIEDGVHLVKTDDSPTTLDPRVYNMGVQEEFIVNGNQFYWVRIGNTKAMALSSNDWIPIIALSFILFCIITTYILWYYAIKHFYPKFHTIAFTSIQIQGWKSFIKNMFIFILPFAIASAFILNGFVYGALVGGLTHAACDGFVDAKASDGTILLKVDKIHPETNTLYMKSGVNLTKLTHLSDSGKILTMSKSVLGSGTGVTTI